MLEHGLQVVEMFNEGTFDNNDIVDIHKACRLLKSSQDAVHQPLECHRGIAEPEQHDSELKQALSCTESSFFMVCLIHLHLLVPAKDTEPLRSCKRIEHVIDLR